MMAGTLPANCAWLIPGYLGICNGPPIIGPDLPPLNLPSPSPDLPPLTLPDVTPLPNSGAVTQDRALEGTRDDVCTEGCDACIAARSGGPKEVTYHANRDKPISGTATRGYAYQAFVSGLPHDPANGKNVAWSWVGYEWDGIEVATCTMLEAKYGYDIFMPYNAAGPTALPGKEFLLRSMFRGMITQLTSQLALVAPFSSEVKLRWVFSHQNPMTYFQILANAGNKVGFQVEYRPYD
jgi:Restriction endonuclease fold toxin 5